MATRRRFTQEYQDQAVSLVLHSGRTIRDVAKSIGVHEITLGKWVNKAKGSDSDQDRELSETERAELERLRKENAVLRIKHDFAKKSCGLVRERTAVKYAAIADWAQEKQYSVTLMRDQIGVTRQGYYRWRAAGPCQRQRTDAEFTEAILAIHTEHDGHPDVRRIWAELISRGMRVSPKRVWRLMRATGLRGRHPRAWRKTTIAGQRPVNAPDLIGQDFRAGAADTRWCGDITYV